MSQFPEEPLNLTSSEGFGYYPSYPGQKLNGYEITRKLGYGPKSSVWMATKLDEYFAIKILTAHETSLKSSSSELDALNIAGRQEYINLHDHFTENSHHGSHLCLVLDVAGPSYEHLRLTSPTKSLPRHVVQRGIACVVEELKKLHKCGLIHGAVTASNIVFDIDTSPEEIDNEFSKVPPCTIERSVTIDGVEYPIVRSHPVPDGAEWNFSWANINRRVLTLINLGHAQKTSGTPTWEKSRTDKSLQPPETILGLPYSSKVDTWMLGCTTYHLLTGRPLVTEEKGKDDGTLLGWLIAMSGGSPTPDMVSKSEYFDENGLFKLEIPKETLESQIISGGVIPADDIPGIVKFVQACLTIDPAKRPSADDLFDDDWVQPGYEG